jgi:prepilin-type processing-associated H-X9-DG protein
MKNFGLINFMLAVSIICFVTVGVEASDIIVLAESTGYNGGDGTESSPYEIATAEQLQEIGLFSMDWDKHFILTNSIYFESYNNDNDWPNFNRIGSYVVPFTGTFDGNNNAVVGLFFSSEEVDNVGMFGCIGEGGVVRDLYVRRAAIDADGGINVGILAGINEGTVENCRVSGMVIGNYATGGIVGLNWYYATISGCDSTGEVIGTFKSTGGIVGDNYGTIEKSCSKAFVSGKIRVGSIAGYNAWGVIENCYSHANPDGDTEVGGLVGRNNYGEITNCFSTGTPTAESYAGALIGKEINDLGTFTACFYDIDINPAMSGIGNLAVDPDGIIGETSDNLKLASTYTGWDTTTPIWTIRDNVDYPRFHRQLLLPYDIAGSWDIDLADLQVMASNWLQTGFTPENAFENGDFDVSGTVDLADFSIIANTWMVGQQLGKVSCAAGVTGLMTAMNIYQFENEDDNPPDMETLIAEADVPTESLTCPNTHDHYPESSYAYRGADLDGTDPTSLVIIYDKTGNHIGGRNVGFGDWHVEWMTEADFLAAIEIDNQWRASQGLEEIPIE